MFRQVISVRWKDGVTEQQLQAYRQALDLLRTVPQVVAMTWGEDAGHFEGNFDLVAVMDFADFASARVYTQHPLHHAYVHDHASKVVGERVVVQHEWTPA